MDQAIADKIIPDVILDSHHVCQYLHYSATRSLFSKHGGGFVSNSDDHLSSVSVFVCCHTFCQYSPLQSSLKKIMTMLGRVRARQEAENPTLHTERPCFTEQTRQYQKALMITAQRQKLEYVFASFVNQV